MSTRENIESVHPLTPTQKGMLLAAASAPGAGLFVEQVVATLRHEIDPVLLEEAWKRVVARHGALRTGFVWKDQKEPLAVVFRTIPFAVEVGQGEPRRRFVASGALSAFFLATMFGYHAGWTPWAELVLATAVVFGCGKEFFVDAARRLRHRSADMDTLIALGSRRPGSSSSTRSPRGRPVGRPATRTSTSRSRR